MGNKRLLTNTKGKMMRRNFIAMLFLCTMLTGFFAFKAPTYKLALLKYSGGDWYSNPTALPNLSSFCNAQIGYQS